MPDRNTKKRLNAQKASFVGLWVCASILVLTVFVVLFYIAYHGIGVISIDFLTQPPKKMMSEGGILPAIIGSNPRTVT